MEDTFAPVMAKIAGRILLAGLPLREFLIAPLTEVFQGRRTTDQFNLEIEQAKTNVNFAVEDGMRWKVREADFQVDEKGDEYVKATVHIEINYPTHGACSVDLFAERAAFFQQIASFAKSLELEFSGEYLKLSRTAEQVKKNKEDHAKSEAQRLAIKFIMDNKGAQRVGKSKTFKLFGDFLTGIPNGSYSHGYAGRKFDLVVFDGNGTITRNA